MTAPPRWRCPLTGAPLTPAGDHLAAPGIRYPIVDGVPLLAPWHASGDAVPPRPLDLARAAEIRDETAIYDRLAAADRAHLAHARRRLLGPALDAAIRRDAVPATFPDPLATWIDSVGSADTQAIAYRHLAPLADARVLQLGGTGSHAHKALLAGAAHATLLSPALEEIQLARALAADLGVADRFTGLVAIGERIPLPDATLDRVYGGGCLHHTAIEDSLPELARVLAPGGRAAFVDPLDNPIYRAWTALAGHRARFCGDEEGTHDHPLDAAALLTLARRHFTRVELHPSGGPLRYAVILAARTLHRAPAPARAARWYTAERRLLHALRLDALYGNLALCLTR